MHNCDSYCGIQYFSRLVYAEKNRMRMVARLCARCVCACILYTMPEKIKCRFGLSAVEIRFVVVAAVWMILFVLQFLLALFANWHHPNTHVFDNEMKEPDLFLPSRINNTFSGE